jgi:large subunit ribosomal protein L32
MLPPQRKSRTQTRKGRAHLALKPAHSVRCPNCGGPKFPHAACMDCGYVRPGLRIQTGKEE